MKNKLKIYFQFIIFLSLLISTTFYFIKTKNIYTQTSIVTNSIINQEKIAYLTIDDGPSKNTNKILEILDQYNIKATFFVVGPSSYLKNEYLKKIVEAGHQLAIHSYQHDYSYIYESKENYIEDFKKCLNWIKETTGITPTLYRFPGGSSNTIATKQLIKSIIKELEEKGFTHADWNVDTLDSYIKNEANKIINNVITAIKKNENNKHYYQTILLHDDINKTASIKALPSLIETILSLGYHFETLKEQSHIIKHIK